MTYYSQPNCSKLFLFLMLVSIISLKQILIRVLYCMRTYLLYIIFLWQKRKAKSGKPCFSHDFFCCVHPQCNRHMHLSNSCLVKMAIQDINKTFRGNVFWYIALKRIWKTLPLVSCRNNLYLFKCLHLLINCDLLFSRLFFYMN